ncbi:folylpolyglutamate synthase/dihydrofolate synthase family protein [soil metagenome]
MAEDESIPYNADRLLADYSSALERTNRLIDPHHARAGDREDMQTRARRRQGRVRALLASLGNPQDAYPIVHIAGTSGKGSTATAIASILTTAGYRTGLHTSPYLQAATEKIQIDNVLIDARQFSELVDFILDTASGLPEFQGIPITYGEAWVAMILYWFARQRLDIAVLETGAGGRFDLTNVVNPAATVITLIGFDHEETLGSTIADIAWHKAGIIKPGVPVITAVEDPEALALIAGEAEAQRAPLIRVPGPAETIVASGSTDISKRIAFHESNMALAAATVAELPACGFHATEREIQTGIERMRIPGRIERMRNEPLVLLDGAHNPQKMQALAVNLEVLAPVGAGGRRTVVFGALDSKNHIEMLVALIPVVDRFVLTTPLVFGKRGFSPEGLADQIRALNIQGDAKVVADPLDALATAFEMSGPEDAVVVTGSMYLVGNIREYWYATRDIVVQRTPWPVQ